MIKVSVFVCKPIYKYVSLLSLYVLKVIDWDILVNIVLRYIVWTLGEH